MSDNSARGEIISLKLSSPLSSCSLAFAICSLGVSIPLISLLSFRIIIIPQCVDIKLFFHHWMRLNLYVKHSFQLLKSLQYNDNNNSVSLYYIVYLHSGQQIKLKIIHILGIADEMSKLILLDVTLYVGHLLAE